MKIYWSRLHNDYVFSNIFTNSHNTYHFLVKDIQDGAILIEVWPEYTIQLELVAEL